MIRPPSDSQLETLDGDWLDALSKSQQERVATVLEGYLADLESGQEVDRESLLESNPDIAVALEAYFKSIETLYQAGVAVASRDSGPNLASIEPILSASSRLGDFMIKDEIGRGGMGIVYAAEQISLGRKVALKTLPFAAVMDQKQVARFKNEAQAAAGLQHPNIVPVYGVGCERGVHYFSMQMIEGQSLEHAIAQLRGDAGPDRQAAPSKTTANHFSTYKSIRSREFARSVARLGQQAADALHYAHENGVVHRDIKPSNLLLAADGKLWITDFGLARIRNSGNLTLTGDLLGTARYMSPEQAAARMHEVDHRTDIYSLGITLYELLTLQPAFEGDTRQSLLRAVETETPVPPRHLNPSIPVDLETIVLKAIEKNRDDRYSSAAALAEDLEHFLDGRPTLAKRPGLNEHLYRWVGRHRRLVLAGTAVLTMALLILSGAALLVRAEQQRTETEAERAALYLRETQRAVDNFGALVDQRLEHLPGSSGLRAELLGELEKYYSAFLLQAGDDPSFAVDLATTQFRLGAVRQRIGDYQQATVSYASALEAFQKLRRQHPDDADLLADVALCHNNLGQVAAKQGDEQAARAWYQKSISLFSNLAALGHPRGQAGLGRGQMNLGLLLSRQGDREASSVLNQACETLRVLALASPDDLNVIDQLALCENNLASVVLPNDPTRAETLLQHAIERYQRLVAARPASPEHRSDQALALGNLAAVLARRNQNTQAIALLRDSIEHRKMLTELEPEVRSHAQDLVLAHQQMGQLLVGSGQWTEAKTAYLAAYQQLNQLVDTDQQDHRSLSNLARTTSNLALIESHLGNQKQAEDYFTEAIETQQVAIGLAPNMLEYGRLLEHHRQQALRLQTSESLITDDRPTLTAGQ